VHSTASTHLRAAAGIPRVVPDRRMEQFRIDDYGYKFNYHRRGDPLPRMKYTATQPVPPLPRARTAAEERTLDEYDDESECWKEDALEGQNDYIGECWRQR
jgi:hypothetical protein